MPPLLSRFPDFCFYDTIFSPVFHAFLSGSCAFKQKSGGRSPLPKLRPPSAYMLCFLCLLVALPAPPVGNQRLQTDRFARLKIHKEFHDAILLRQLEVAFPARTARPAAAAAIGRSGAEGNEAPDHRLPALQIHVERSDALGAQVHHARAAYAAAGATLGTVAGALAALVFLILLFCVFRKDFKMHMKHDTELRSESG